MSKFALADNFINKYKRKKAPFGFNGLGELVYMRTYSRIKDDGKNEKWWETVRRVVEGTYNLQKEWIENNELEWNPWKAQKSAQEMYDRIFSMKFLPPGRGLWAMGSPITEERKMHAALFNCAFFSTDNIDKEFSKPFCFMMDMSMLGVGVGFDVKGAGKVIIQGPNSKRSAETFVISDDREGWVESLRLLLTSYVHGTAPVEFDYSQIRGPGEPIVGFGGISSGPAPLEKLHGQLRDLLSNEVGQPISERAIVDIMNMIGVCIVAGNVRRTAQIVFGDPDSEEYLDLKNYEANPERAEYGWSSNNSIFAQLGMDYSDAAERTRINGEPGYIWMDNVRAYSRMCDEPDWKDKLAAGANPCFSPDTLIAVADGRDPVSILELSQSGEDVPVYSVNKEGLVEIKWARNPRKTRENAELLRIHFNDGSHLDVTPDHKMMLKNGEWCQAQELKKGDSLPPFSKRKEKMKEGGQDYWRVYGNTKNCDKNKVMEHRLIAKFNDPEIYDSLYDENQQNGWSKGGLVVHHRDYNGLNNRPDNLEIMSFRDHSKLHQSNDFNGENNPMYGKTHSEETKAKIGAKTRERSQDPAFKEKVRKGHEPHKETYAENLRQISTKNWKEFFLEQEAKTDLDTFWIGESLYVRKKCQCCGSEMHLPWGKRHAVYCSSECHMKALNENHKTKRKENHKAYYEDKQRQTLHDQIGIFLSLKNPQKRDWERACKEANISFRLNKHSDNPHVLKNWQDLKDRAESYNHRVIRVEKLTEKQDVYNLTVDDNSTVGIVTKIDDKAHRGVFTYQCNEQSLQSGELCCLVETFPHNHDSVEDYLRTLKFAYLYGKSVTLAKTHWKETNRIMLRNRRIGTSMSGIAQFITYRGLNELKKWCDKGYNYIQELDEKYSDWLAIPKSIKTTSIKPSGSVSLLAGATPGMHYPESHYYIRRMRISVHSDLIKPLEKAGYHIEPAASDPENTLVVSIPICIGKEIKTVNDVSVWEQFSLASFLQRYWADNQVSCTVTFKPEDGYQIEPALDYFQYSLKGISLLPKLDLGAFEQMPYEEITEEQFEEMNSKIKAPNFGTIKGEEAEIEKFCNNDTCEIVKN